MVSHNKNVISEGSREKQNRSFVFGNYWGYKIKDKKQVRNVKPFLHALVFQGSGKILRSRKHYWYMVWYSEGVKCFIGLSY